MKTLLRRLAAVTLALLLPSGQIVPAFAVSTDGTAANWTREKAEHLARKALFAATPAMVDSLYSAGSASAAAALLFPDANGPDRTLFDAEISNLTASGFNWGDGGHMNRLYHYRLARDPYEAKAKLSLLFEDIFSVNNGSNISYRDVKDLHDLLFRESLGNYKAMVKKVLFNGVSGDYAEGKFLDLLDQSDKRYPNENYARELLQLFLMGEYEPGESKENGDPRNYEETDVAALAKILTGFRSDPNTHVVTYDPAYHNTSTGVVFLSGSANDAFPFYDSASGTLDLGLMDDSVLGNNGLADNTIDYVFSKRATEISLFVADRLFRFYVHNDPTRGQLDALASVLRSNSFELLPTIRFLLASDAPYSDASMNAVTYKNPVELTVGTLKLLHAGDSSIDPLLSDTSLLSRFNWTPYFAGSVFGRDGFDDNAKWYSTYLQNQWISYANRIAYSTATGSFDLSQFVPPLSVSVTWAVSVSTSASNSYSGSVAFLSGSFDVTPALDGSGALETLAFGPLSLRLPNFDLQTASGTLSVTSGTYDPVARTLSVSAGSFAQSVGSGGTFAVSNGLFEVDPASVLERGALPSELIDRMEAKLLLGRRLPSDVRTRMETFLTTDESGNPTPFRPGDAAYQRKKVRSLLAMVLAQPEFVLQTGYDVPASAPGSGNSSPVSNASGKLLIVELGGGYDWLHGIIPKDEYAEYVSKRTLASGSGIALDTGRLTDLGDFYMNNAIAYASGGTAPSFKALFDSGNLKIFNRVGTTKHSRDHDAAAKQIASYSNVTDAEADGVFGRLVKDSGNSTDAISLGNRRPNAFRSGRYANIGPSGAILSNPYVSTAERDAELTAVRDIANSRSYPGSVADLFKTAIGIDQIAAQSKASGGPDGAGWGNVNNLRFLESLLDGNVGKAFYMQADGGYDTHSNQLAAQSNFDPNNVPRDLNYNIGNVAANLSNFFNRVKDRHNVTIVVFSEFGRTIAVNGDIGTDHGQGGGMFVLSNDPNVLSALPNSTYGNLSVKNAKDNWLGVGIDYRSVYGKLYSALYGVSPTSYFTAPADLAKDTDTSAARYSLLRPEYRANSDSSVRVDVRFRAEGANFDPNRASYLKAWYGTGTTALRQVSQWQVDNYYRKSDGSFSHPRDWNAERSNYAFVLQAFTNQYVPTVYTGSVRLPDVLAASVNEISRTSDSVLRRYDSTNVSGYSPLAGGGFLLANSGTGAGIVIESSGWVRISTQTGATYVRSLTASGTAVWNGGFLLGETVDPETFLSSDAVAVSGSTALRSMGIAKIVKVGADALGVGMELDRSVTLSFSGVSPSSEYRILRSEDGLSWIDQTGSTVFSDAAGRLSFDTSNFSYFAAVSAVPPPPPTCTVAVSMASVTDGTAVTVSWTSSGATAAALSPSVGSVALSGSVSAVPSAGTVTSYRLDVTGAGGSGSCSANVASVPRAPVPTPSPGTGGGGGGGSAASFGRDACPSGDDSPSYYDGTCGTPSSMKTAVGSGSSVPAGSKGRTTGTGTLSANSDTAAPKAGVSESWNVESLSSRNSGMSGVGTWVAPVKPKAMPEISSVLRLRSVARSENGEIPDDVLRFLDAMAASSAREIIARNNGNPRKMAKHFHVVKLQLDARAKRAPELSQKRAVAYVKSKMDEILRSYVERTRQ